MLAVSPWVESDPNGHITFAGNTGWMQGWFSDNSLCVVLARVEGGLVLVSEQPNVLKCGHDTLDTDHYYLGGALGLGSILLGIS